jgi:hypothetical protein
LDLDEIYNEILAITFLVLVFPCFYVSPEDDKEKYSVMFFLFFYSLLLPSFAVCWERMKPLFSGPECERGLFAGLREWYTSADMRTVKKRDCTSWGFPILVPHAFPFEQLPQ